MHYFIGADDTDVVFHSAAELQAHWAEIASALGRALQFTVGVATPCGK